MEELARRYEIPNAKQRWDSPLFEISIGDFKESEKEDKNFETEIELKQISKSISEPNEVLLPRNISLPFDDLYQHLIKV